jgi:glycosyltransferase involved in cell wall biosynthesis
MTEKLRVMQITNNLGIGGLERVVVNLCRHLDRKRFEVAACCLNFRGPFADELERDGIPVYLTPHRTDRTDYLVFWNLKNIMKQVRPHIVHTHNTNALFDGFLASMLARVPLMIHTDHARKFPDKLRYMTAERFIAHFLDHIVAVSEETRGNLIHYEHIPTHKLSVVNNGIDGARYNILIDTTAKRCELGLDGFSHLVGLGVRLTPQKGIIHLIKAAPLILKHFPEVAFVVAGDGYLLSELKAQAQAVGVGGHFFFLGPRLDLPEILQILDVYVLPSEWEGLPLVILEAMAARKAIIATDVGGNSTAIEHDLSGLLVPSKDPLALAKSVCELLDDPVKRDKLACEAQRRFYATFEVKHMAKEYEKIYLKHAITKGLN